MAKRRTRAGTTNTKPKSSYTVFTNVQIETTQLHPTRSHLYEGLERILRRPVVAYFTSFKFPVMIEDDDADMLEGVLRSLDLTRGLALIVNSPGGDGEAAERIVNLCRTYSKTGDFWAIVPGKAKSAATMVCFGASRIIMGPSSELGPVDPQIIYAEDGRRKQISAYNLVTSYDRLFKEAVSTQGRIEPYIQQLDHYDARDIQRCREAIDLADDIAVKTLRSGMMKSRSESVVRKKIDAFLTPQRTKSHGRPIFRDEAKQCGLAIRNADTGSELWGLAHELHVRLNHLVSSRSSKCIESRADSYTVAIP